ncbi:MAG: hypothetical protein ABJF10_12025 [Chthoniobacter sp.]
MAESTRGLESPRSVAFDPRHRAPGELSVRSAIPAGEDTRPTPLCAIGAGSMN